MLLIRAFSDLKAFFYIFCLAALKPPIKICKKALKSEKARIKTLLPFVKMVERHESVRMCSKWVLQCKMLQAR